MTVPYCVMECPNCGAGTNYEEKENDDGSYLFRCYDCDWCTGWQAEGS